MNWKLPNQLTVSRIILSLGFFVLLGFYEQGTSCGSLLLTIAFVVYVVAGITDILDGYFARKWNITSAFGRMVDPMVDKVLVLGAFIMLAGNNFAMPADAAQHIVSDFERSLPTWLTGGMTSGVQAWMVVAILVRELVISGVRGFSESCGKSFPATYSGKIKMFVQSFAISTILFQLANFTETRWMVILKIVSIWLAVIVTIISGIMYITKARNVLKSSDS